MVYRFARVGRQLFDFVLSMSTFGEKVPAPIYLLPIVNPTCFKPQTLLPALYMESSNRITPTQVLKCKVPTQQASLPCLNLDTAGCKEGLQAEGSAVLARSAPECQEVGVCSLGCADSNGMSGQLLRLAHVFCSFCYGIPRFPLVCTLPNQKAHELLQWQPLNAVP